MKDQETRVREITVVADQVELGKAIITKLAGGVLNSSAMANLSDQLSIRINNKINKMVDGGNL